MNGSDSRVGTLYVVATPIGNLGDVSRRVQETLTTCDVIAAEDTRRTGQLLAHLGVRRPLVSLHAHNEAQRAEGLLERLLGGASVALVSDAGTPLVSDPGARLVAEAVRAGVVVVPVPGPSAVLAALVGSGFAADRFVFEGFLPRKGGERRARLAALGPETRVTVLYESPRRIRRTLADLLEALGGSRRIAVGRELTKLHEEFVRARLDDLVEDEATLARLERGELVIVIEGAAPDAAGSGGAAAPEAVRALVRALAGVLPAARIARLLGPVTGLDRRTLYRMVDGDDDD